MSERLIDAEALIKVFDPNTWQGEMMIRVIQSAPTIEPKRGEWIQKKTAIGKTYSVCSRCETDFKFKTDRGTLARLDMDGMSFCPNCGAKMGDGFFHQIKSQLSQ